MSNLENKEQQFAKTLSDLTKHARRQGGTVTEEEIRDAFDALELSDNQYNLIYEYLKTHNIGIGETIDSSEYLSKEESGYLSEYLEELSMLEPVTDGEKEAIIISAMAGEKDAQKRLVELSLPMVADVAKLYAEQGVLIEDLIGEGNIALMKATQELSGLDDHKECDSYLAQMVMDAMENLIEDDAAETARAQKAVQLVQEVADKAKELADELRRSCTVEELAEETGWEVSKILEAIKACGNQIEDIDYTPEKNK